MVGGRLTRSAHELEKDIAAALATARKPLIRRQPDLMRRTMPRMMDFVSPSDADVVAGNIEHGATGAYHVFAL